jgi:cytochrome c
MNRQLDLDKRMKFAKQKLRAAICAAFLLALSACADRESEPVATANDAKVSDTAATATAVVENAAAMGKRLFASCSFCHTTNPGGSSTVGPNLADILGAAAGGKSDFVYSKALTASGIIWTEETLDSYIESPARFIPGGSMGFVGIADASEREVILAHLIKVTNAETAPAVQGEDVAIWE